MTLPFLIVHGDVAWIPLLVALSTISLAVLHRRGPTSMLVRASVACGVALSWYLILFGFGSLALHVGGKGHGRNLRFHQFSATVIAAAMPGTRDDALSLYEQQLAGRFENTEAALQLRAAFSEYDGHCPVDVYFESMHYDDALEAAHRCGSRRQIVQALVSLGRYKEAAQQLAPDDHSFLATLVYISTGTWNAAALGAEASAATERDPVIAAKYRCLAALFRTYGGDRDAFTRIEDMGTGWSCPVFKALSLPFDHELPALRAIRGPEESSHDSDVLDLAREIMDAHRGALYAFVGEQADFNLDRKVWWAPFLEDGTDEPEFARSSMEAARGDFDVLNGNFELAATRLASVHGDFLRLQLQNLLQQRTGAMPDVNGDPQLPEWMLLRTGRPLPADRRLTIDRDDERLAIAAAQGGDGAPLAALLQTSDAYFDTEQLLMGLLPLVRTHRAELATALQSLHRTSRTYLGYPFTLLSDLANQRDLSRLAGDSVGANATQAIFARHAAVLSDRRRLIGLRVWTGL